MSGVKSALSVTIDLVPMANQMRLIRNSATARPWIITSSTSMLKSTTLRDI